MHTTIQPPDDDALIDEFVSEWESYAAGGARPALERYLSTSIPAIAQRTRLIALLDVEISRRLQLNELPRLEEYLTRLPRFGDILATEFDRLMKKHGQGDATRPFAGDLRPSVMPQAPGQRIPEQIGQYRIEALLGAGAFGQVYRAFDPELRRQVAIKFPHAHRLRDLGGSASFREEARSLAALDHPAVVRVLHVGQEGDHFFIVTEFVDGGDLKDRVEKRPMTPAEAAECACEIAEGLHHAHKHGFIHRDIKPANILLDRDGRPKIADFGLALNYSNFGKGPRLAGSIPYMSPEQAREEGHRVDGRSDIFSLGAVLYELLTSVRPFQADNPLEILDQIIKVEPRPPRQIDDSIPRELERICLKALAKRATDRYSCARDMAEDLKAHLEASLESTRSSSGISTRSGEFTIVPKGLRTFDATDADTFLRLLPGPFDRNGLPEAIRFWKLRLEATDTETTLQVGVVYGPSGCGKSSLIRAGLLPRLANHVLPIYLEATPEGTEKDLHRLTMQRFPDFAPEQDLSVVLRRLRSDGPLARRKLLIVLDQFEQWLHGNPASQDRLADALRHCDGEHIQCLLIVRDDFWLGVSRFMGKLEIPLLEGSNSLLIDLFGRDHARSVLRQFGVAYDRLPAKQNDLTQAQQDFLTEAVEMLAVEGRVVPVQMAMLVEMLKNKDWTRDTLAEFGGASGIGVAFLSTTFESVATLAKHRAHRDAAAAVLESLLPETMSDLKGKMRSRNELLIASGYGEEEPAFDELLRILDQELRLITPTVSFAAEAGTRSTADGTPHQLYQLTHDYLVPSLREWLARRKATNRRGRAELLLAERTSQWSLWRDDRFLPNLREFLSIGLWTRQATRSQTQNQMVARAGRVHGGRVGLTGLLLAFVVSSIWYARSREQLNNLADRLLHVDPPLVLATIGELAEYGDRGQRLLQARYQSTDEQQRLPIAVALLPEENCMREVQRELLSDRRSANSAARFELARDALAPFKSQVTPDLRQIVTASSASAHRRFRAASALMHYDPSADRDSQVVGIIVDELVELDPTERRRWQVALRNEIEKLREPLLIALAERELDTERARVFDILIEEFADEAEVLIELIALASPVELKRLLLVPLDHHRLDRLQQELQSNSRKLLALRHEMRPPIEKLDAELEEKLDARTPDLEATIATLRADIRSRQAELFRGEQRLIAAQANIGIALLATIERAEVWPLLWPMPEREFDVGVRSEILSRIRASEVDPTPLLDHFSKLANSDWKGNPAALRTLLVAMGHVATPQNPIIKDSQLRQLVRSLYQTHPDPGVHSAAEWSLRKNGIELETISTPVESGRRWFLNNHKQTFAVLGPDEFLMGSPRYERNRDHELIKIRPPDGSITTLHGEEQRATQVERFAIAMHEVSVIQFQIFDTDYRPLTDVVIASDPHDPAHNIGWQQAGDYCNWLSGEEGISLGEFAFDAESRTYDVTKLGYRLPTPAEWEYACRAGIGDSRFLGDLDHLLADYAWYFGNSGKDKFLPVGSLIPNDFGLFDTLGNVTEWCAGRMYYQGQALLMGRGGAYDDPARYLRAAQILSLPEGQTLGSMGFRLAQTRRE